MKTFLAAILITFVGGCSGIGNVHIDPASVPAFGKGTLALVIYESPAFMAMTADKSMFVERDVDAAYAEGQELVRRNRIDDPADEISTMLARAISTKHGLRYNELAVIKSKSKKMKDLLHLANKKDFLLDVETTHWHFTSRKYQQPDYLLGYVARIRLVDVKQGATVAASNCEYDTAKAGKPLVSYETLVENDAAYIKRALVEASRFCVDRFMGDLD